MKKIYNDEMCLNDGTASLEQFKPLINGFRLDEQEEARDYFETMFLYDEFISKLVEFLKSLNYKESIEYSLVISYLIHNGYLSRNHFFDFDESDFELFSKAGISILNGSGLCRNISYFTDDTLKGLGERSKLLFCAHSSFQFLREWLAANHVINLIEFKDQIYGIDLSNEDRLFRFDNSFDLSEIALHSHEKLRYKPYHEIVVCESSLKTIRKNLRIFDECSRKKTIHPFFYEEFIKKDMAAENEKNRSLYEDFYHDTERLRGEIIHSYEEITKGRSK